MNQEWKANAGDFLPGANLTVLSQWERKAVPAYERADVSVPGRLHFAVFDFMQMAPGLGGGGIGVSTSTVGHQVIVSKTTEGNGGCDVASGQHMLELFKRTVGYRGNDIRISRARSIKHKHSGFGSNVSYNTATMAGLMRCSASVESDSDSSPISSACSIAIMASTMDIESSPMSATSELCMPTSLSKSAA